MTLYEYLATQFNTIDGAIEFYNKWKYDWGQMLPEEHFGGDCYSLRAMAAHCSNVLEGKPEPDGPTEYINTKYGSQIYFSSRPLVDTPPITKAD